MSSEDSKKIDLSGGPGLALKEIISEGEGTETPFNGSKVVLHYTGRFVDGTVFDSSVQRNQPFEFDLGKGSVIKAFDLGAASMKKKEKCFLTCAPEYAYGPAGSPPTIPPNATLIFELEMLDWRGEDISPNSDNSIEKFIVEPSTSKREPSKGTSVKVHLIGNHEGRVFDDREVQFDLGEGEECNVVEGIEFGIANMHKGETCKFILKSNYAFGDEGSEQFQIPGKATIEYIVKLLDFQTSIEEWKLTPRERIQQATIYKEKGTKYFKNNKFKLAIHMYNRAVEINNLGKYEALEIVEEARILNVALMNNLALSYQKVNNYYESKSACDKALVSDDNNIKALYRRGQCSMALSEFEDAATDFMKILSLEPDNKAAQSQLRICKQKTREHNEKEKKLYANMFTKFGQGRKEPDVETNSDTMSKCGEWSDGDGKFDPEMDLTKIIEII